MKKKETKLLNAAEWYRRKLKKRAIQTAGFSAGVIAGSCVLKFAHLSPIVGWNISGDNASMVKVGVGMAVLAYDLAGSFILTSKVLDDWYEYIKRAEKEDGTKSAFFDV